MLTVFDGSLDEMALRTLIQDSINSNIDGDNFLSSSVHKITNLRKHLKDLKKQLHSLIEKEDAITVPKGYNL